PGKSISLIGGNVIFDGGVINAIANNINIAAIQSGTVKFAISPIGLVFDYDKVNLFGDINLTNHSFILNNGIGLGNINLTGDDINLNSGSTILLNNIGQTQIGDINIDAKKNLSIIGSPNEDVPKGYSQLISGIISSSLSSGKGGNINISGSNLYLKDIGKIFSTNFSTGDGGNINLNIKNLISILEHKQFPSAGSLIGAVSFSSGRAGNINILTNRLLLKDGANLVSATFGAGDAGNITINADSIMQIGFNATTLNPTLISSFTGGDGSGGNVFINSKNLILLNGGRLDASTLDGGSAGSVFINSDNIIVAGTFPAEFNGNSYISSSGNKLDPFTQSFYRGIKLNLTGDAGNVTITSKNILVQDGGQISVKNDGPGNAGKLSISSDFIHLQNGNITASTQGGDGGTIELNSKVTLLQGGNIIASARNNGNGGNVTINSPFVIGDNNSFIQANAENAPGGNITINSDVLLFPIKNITASSQLGSSFDGSIQLNSSKFSINPSLLNSIQPVQKIQPISCDPTSNKQSPNPKIESSSLSEQTNSPIENIQEDSSTFYYLDLKTRKRIPLSGEMTGWVDNGDGTASAISIAKSDHVTSLTPQCLQAKLVYD
ncbi:MAG: hypothetical protein WCD18_05605, partial [Thermosynechococcaceae cyanobacterium]